MSWRWILYPPFDSDNEWPQASIEEIEQAEGRMHVLREHVWKVMVEILARSFTCELFEAKWSDIFRHATAAPE